MRIPPLRRWTGAAILLVGTLLFHHWFHVDRVSGSSMAPTFQDGDWLLVARRHPGSPDPRRGDVVIARSPTGYLVKRIVGLPGETVEVIDGAVHIDGLPRSTVSVKRAASP